MRHVTKRFGDRVAVHGVDLDLSPERTTVLLGPSGCGKSTLLRLMMGLLAPDEGQVCFEGRNLADTRGGSIRRRFGYVIQDGGLFPHLTARRNVTLMARHVGWEPRRIEERLRRLCALTRLPVEALDLHPVQLSGGQRQRVSLMRALMLDPGVLLLDEPLGALDPMIRARLQTDLRHVFREFGKTVVLVTHDVGEAGFLGDEIVLLREGSIAQRGSLEDLVRRPASAFVTEFVRAQRSPLESIREESP